MRVVSLPKHVPVERIITRRSRDGGDGDYLATFHTDSVTMWTLSYASLGVCLAWIANLPILRSGGWKHPWQFEFGSEPEPTVYLLMSELGCGDCEVWRVAESGATLLYSVGGIGAVRLCPGPTGMFLAEGKRARVSHIPHGSLACTTSSRMQLTAADMSVDPLCVYDKFTRSFFWVGELSGNEVFFVRTDMRGRVCSRSHYVIDPPEMPTHGEAFGALVTVRPRLIAAWTTSEGMHLLVYATTPDGVVPPPLPTYVMTVSASLGPAVWSTGPWNTLPTQELGLYGGLSSGGVCATYNPEVGFTYPGCYCAGARVFVEPDVIAVATMSSERVGWMVAVARAILWRSGRARGSYARTR